MRLAGALLVCVCAVCAASLPAGADTALTLRKALALAYENNPRLEAARADVRAADERVAAANAGWRPHVDATGSYGAERTRVFEPAPPFNVNNHPWGGGVNLNQPIFDGSVVARIQQTKALVRANRQQMTATEQGILFEAITAYLGVLRDTEILERNRANVDVLRRQVEATREQLRLGAVTRTDLTETEARTAAANRTLTQAMAQLMTSRSAFKRVIGRQPETLEASTEEVAIPEESESAVLLALNENPALLQVKEQERAADYGVSVAVGQLLPKVSLNVGYRYDRDKYGIAGLHSTEEGLVVTGQLTVPLYDGGLSIAATREANILHDRSRYAVIDAERAVRQSVEDAWQEHLAAIASVEASRIQVRSSEEAVGGVRQEQQAGERQIIDILNAQQELFSAQVLLAAAEHDLIVSSYKILLSMGKLTAKDLHLDVKLYDPDDHYNGAAGMFDLAG